MKKIKKQPPVTPERSETPVSPVCYVLWYERYSSYCSKNGKKLKQSPVTPERSETPVSQVRSSFFMNCIVHTAGRLRIKNSHPHVSQVPHVPHVRFVSRESPDPNNIFKFSQTSYLRKLFETNWNIRIGFAAVSRLVLSEVEGRWSADVFLIRYSSLSFIPPRNLSTREAPCDKDSWSGRAHPLSRWCSLR